MNVAIPSFPHASLRPNMPSNIGCHQHTVEVVGLLRRDAQGSLKADDGRGQFFNEKSLVVYAYGAHTGYGIKESILDPIVNEINQPAMIALDVHHSRVSRHHGFICSLLSSKKRIHSKSANTYFSGYASKWVRHVVPTTTSDSPILRFVIEPSPNDEWGNLWGGRMDMLHRIYYGFSTNSYQDQTTVNLDNLKSFDEWLQRVLLTKKQPSEEFFRILSSLNTEKAAVDFNHYNLVVVHAVSVNEQENASIDGAGIYKRLREEHD